mmetsp:Transcript_8404/g.15422  ORF Transcript_8404/g.15422 Transcript_8404/m.15422 type:complete len:192 (+) Transcript_8404:949-1524(+)
MQTHSTSVHVAEYGCGALLYLPMNTENQVSLMAAGAAEVVLTAMRQHSANSKVAHYGCGAPRNLARNSSAREAALKAADAVDVVVLNVMQVHETDPDVVEEGDKALEALQVGFRHLPGGLEATSHQEPRPASAEQTIQPNTCVICFEDFDGDTRAITVFTCGHTVCETCAHKQTKCHTCRKTISRRIRLFM